VNRVDIRTKARQITELTSSDVPDEVIDLYARDGYERIINLERRWPSFETTTSFSTVAGQADYSIADDLLDLIDFKSFRNDSDGVRLQIVGYEDAEDLWAGSSDGPPMHWSVWAGNLRLWPTPNDVYTYTVRGYRRLIAWWESDGVEIDADERLHTAILYFVISRLYQLQEDAEMTSLYAQSFAEAVQLARAEIMRSSSARPLVLSGGTRVRRHTLLDVV
jgi:hypothetical protein